jgi:hypothetical protein
LGRPPLRLVDPEPQEHELEPVSVDIADEPKVIVEGGILRVEHDDGSVTYDLDSGKLSIQESDENDFYRNLANDISSDDLSRISSDLLTGIDLDKQARKDWLDTRATGIRLLGLKLEEPRGDLGSGSSPLEGMSQIRHPLLLEATIRFQATARGELLPAAGPVKVRNDLPARPDATPDNPFAPPGIGHNSGEAPEGAAMDDLAAALEKDLNHFLTKTATEYVPDTDRMLFYVGFGGEGWKKVYNHVLKRRPVSESVDAEDVIVSNSATDIRNCARFTHRIKMRPSMLRRMQIAGAYRDVAIGSPNPNMELTAPEQEKADIAGIRPQSMQPKDGEYEIYECYCELDLDEFAPKQFKGKNLPLPYVVTIEKDSRQVLAVTRNWDEDDEQCLAKQFFVQYPFIRGLGFYGLGLVHILGNVVLALTAIWRIMIDNGMFSNFPGFLFSKGAGRQNTNQIRVPPGGGFPVDVPPGMRIQDAFMPLPYKDTGASFTNLGVHIEEVGQRLGQTAELNIGEGKQDVPVGTTMALIEQATKIMDSVHKRLHAAQAEEFQLLKERFREDPEAFWRHNKKPARQWTVEQFKQAIEQNELVPVADPNNPTSLHRIAKATIIDMLVSKYPLDIDRRNALKRIMRIADIDADGLMNEKPADPPPDPRMEAIKAKAQAEQMRAQIDQVKVQIQAMTAQAEFADAEKEREFKERMQQFEMQIEQLRLQAEMVIHADELRRANLESQADIQGQQAELMHNIVTSQANHEMDMQQQAQRGQQEIALQQIKTQQQLAAERAAHQQRMELERQKQQAKIESDRKIAEAKAQAVGPTEQAKNDRETEKHEQQLQINEAAEKRAGEKHKVELTNSKVLAKAKAKALSRPKPKPSGDKK